MGDIIGRGQAYERLTTRTGALGNWLNLLLFIGIVGLLHGQSEFSFQLSEGGLTSAAVYDSRGQLVRTLWTQRTLAKGPVTGMWDQLDDFGNPVQAGAYRWKIWRNGARYINIGPIGNTGQPPVTSGHVP